MVRKAESEPKAGTDAVEVPGTTPEPLDHDERVGEAIEAFLALAEAGNPPDPEAFAAFWAGRRDISPKWVPRYVRLATGQLPATASNKILKRELAAEGWRAADPVWWRPSRDLSYRLMTPDDTAALRSEFERSGRLNLLEGSG